MVNLLKRCFQLELVMMVMIEDDERHCDDDSKGDNYSDSYSGDVIVDSNCYYYN